MLFYAHLLFITYAILNYGYATGGSGCVTDVESVGSSGTKGGLVASGERETRAGAAKPAIRLLTAAAVGAGASLCGCG